MRRLALLAALGLALAGCGSDDAGEEGSASSEAPIRTITIEETDYALDPSSLHIQRAGTYAFRAVNKGRVGHALEIEGEGIEEETTVLGPGEEATMTIELEEGSYELYCPVGDHQDRGMTAKVGVVDSPPSDTDESDSDDGYG